MGSEVIFKKEKTALEKPFRGEIEEAKRWPNAHVYRIAGQFSSNDAVPPEAIVGAWKVDVHGSITGEFIKNPNYDPKKWPSHSLNKAGEKL